MFIPYNYTERTMDVSYLDYEQLKNLEEEIKKRKTELERTQYENLVNGVLSAIDAIKEAGYGYLDACYDNNGESYTWHEISYKIRQEYARREKED